MERRKSCNKRRRRDEVLTQFVLERLAPQAIDKGKHKAVPTGSEQDSSHGGVGGSFGQRGQHDNVRELGRLFGAEAVVAE